MASSWKRKRRRGVVTKRGGKWENISSSNSFALIWIPSEMSGEVGQWDLESLCCFFFSPSLSLSSYSLVNGKWAMRLGEGKMMSYRECVSEKERERKRQKAGWVVVWGLSWGLSPADCETQTKRGRGKGKREICICAPEEGSGWCLFILILKQQSNYTISPGNMHMRVISK